MCDTIIALGRKVKSKTQMAYRQDGPLPNLSLRLGRACVRALLRWHFYETVPEVMRQLSPWQGNRRGAVEALKPVYLLALARDGYALMRC